METQEMLSLDNLNDIVIPDVPTWWPPPPGLWVVLFIIVVVFVSIIYRLYRQWGRDKYRRAGLQLLDDADTEYEVSIILKRVALAAYPREQVASLYGAEWMTFLHNTCPKTRFPGSFASDQTRKVDQDLANAAAAWIKHHHSAAETQTGA